MNGQSASRWIVPGTVLLAAGVGVSLSLLDPTEAMTQSDTTVIRWSPARRAAYWASGGLLLVAALASVLTKRHATAVPTVGLGLLLIVTAWRLITPESIEVDPRCVVVHNPTLFRSHEVIIPYAEVRELLDSVERRSRYEVRYRDHQPELLRRNALTEKIWPLLHERVVATAMQEIFTPSDDPTERPIPPFDQVMEYLLTSEDLQDSRDFYGRGAGGRAVRFQVTVEELRWPGSYPPTVGEWQLGNLERWRDSTLLPPFLGLEMRDVRRPVPGVIEIETAMFRSNGHDRTMVTEARIVRFRATRDQDDSDGEWRLEVIGGNDE